MSVKVFFCINDSKWCTAKAKLTQTEVCENLTIKIQSTISWGYGMLIGYARVSTTDQNTELQKKALIRAECELIFEDTASGKNAQRPGLKKAIRRLRRGDTLMVWKLDRLGRSVRDLIDLVSALQAKGIHFRSLTDSIDTSTPAGRFFFHVMSALAEMERELIVERTRAGLDAARCRVASAGENGL